MNIAPIRDLHLLHAHRATLQCAYTRCIACCYKIVLYKRPGTLPNVRPEMCPRLVPSVDSQEVPVSGLFAKSDQHRIGLYDAAQIKHILTLGDGNFSFSLALAIALGPDSDVHIVATSHESKKTVLETYPDSEKILEKLNSLKHVTVLHEVDATNSKQMKMLGCFDRVIWNFPCVRALRGEDGQNQEMDLNKKLLNDFFANVAQILTPTGEVHVTHKTKKPFGQWGIENIAKINKLRHQKSVVFDRCLYPGYSNKKVLSKGSFPIWDSLTFIFVPEDRVVLDETKDSSNNAAEAEVLDKSVLIEPITADILRKLYLLLTPSLVELLGKKKKKHKESKSSSHGGNILGVNDKCVHRDGISSKSNNKRKQCASDHIERRKRKKGSREY
ncbi:hypothetical protein Plhal304r1_c095g0173491 [Plasmopara halstedii]